MAYCIEKWLTGNFCCCCCCSCNVCEINSSIANIPFSYVTFVGERKKNLVVRIFTSWNSKRENGANKKKKRYVSNELKRKFSVKMINGDQIAHGLFYYLFIKCTTCDADAWAWHEHWCSPVNALCVDNNGRPFAKRS